MRLGRLPGWTARTYPAVTHWPDRMDLWAQWEGRATNLADPNREQTAESYYIENRAAMDAGAVVYWPQKWPLVALMRPGARKSVRKRSIPSIRGFHLLRG